MSFTKMTCVVIDVTVTTLDATVIAVAVETAFTVCVTLIVVVVVEVGRLRHEHPVESAELANLASWVGRALLASWSVSARRFMKAGK